MNIYISYFVVFAAVFVLTVVFARILIPLLKSWKMGQKILDIGPRWHKSKEGTPTMGGLAFIASVVGIGSLAGIILSARGSSFGGAAGVLLYGVLNAAIGVFDDITKFKKSRNEGLSASQKYLLQLAAAALYLVILNMTGYGSTVLHIPFTDYALDFGIFYYVIALLLLTGMVNSVNLTDGIDGLAPGVTFVVAGFFTVIAIAFTDIQLTVLSGALAGAMLGFLVYNYHPARIFMGDTGSLFIGALVVGMAFLIGDPLVIVIAGFIYIAESISVILQVGCYKLTGKRIFKMAPIHHHFEKSGWSELKIVYIFSFITIAACIAAWFSM